MEMTLSERILAKKNGLEFVRAGQIINSKIDLIMATDVTLPMAAKVLSDMGVTKIFDPSKVVLINDHFVPAKDIASANLSKCMKEFAIKHNIKNYFEVGRSGICHIVLPENGFVVPGSVIVGSDSHTCTYGALSAFSFGVGVTDLAAALALGEIWIKVPKTIKINIQGNLKKYVSGKDIILKVLSQLGVDGSLYSALEFHGPTVEHLSMADRFSMSNMAIECGAKTGLFMVDHVTKKYCKSLSIPLDFNDESSKNAEYEKIVDVDVNSIEPLVACPYLPSNVKTVNEVSGVKLNQVVIGSCTNGRIEDFIISHEIIKGKKVHPDTRLILIPGSQKVYLQLVKENLLNDFIEAGALISPPTCGSCIGGHMGVLGDNEVGLFTTNRNFLGRNGAVTSRVYLSNSAVATASAIAGEIIHPYQVEAII